MFNMSCFCSQQTMIRWRHWAIALSIILLSIAAHAPDFIPPTLWPPNSPDLNPVDFKRGLNWIQCYGVLEYHCWLNSLNNLGRCSIIWQGIRCIWHKKFGILFIEPPCIQIIYIIYIHIYVYIYIMYILCMSACIVLRKGK